MFRQVNQRTSVGDQTSSNSFANQYSQVWSDCHHAGLQVVVQMRSVFVNRQDFVAQLTDVQDILLGDFCSHGDFGCFLDLLLEVWWQNVGQVRVVEVFTHANKFDGLDEGDVVGDNLSQFGEMPSEPEIISRSFLKCVEN